MAEIVEKSRVEAVPGVPFKLSWGAIFGGTFVALGVWVLLYSLGLAMGLSSVDPADPSSAKAAGIGTGIWSLITPLIALFAGGWVASRTAGVMDKMGGAVHGAVLWGLTTLAGVIVMGMALSSLLGTAFNVGKTAVSATGSAVASAASGAASQGDNAGSLARTFGLNAEDALAPINQRLKAEGKPPITADQLQASTKDVINSWVNTQTQGKIPTILKETMPEDVLYPLNVPGPTASTQKTRARDRFIRKAAAPSPRTS